jgi:hypothetical protein
MKAIEIDSKTDASGKLNIHYNLDIPNQKVRVLVLYDEFNNVQEEEKRWTEYVSKNPAFSFLREPEEDIYSLKDGEPFND